MEGKNLRRIFRNLCVTFFTRRSFFEIERVKDINEDVLLVPPNLQKEGIPRTMFEDQIPPAIEGMILILIHWWMDDKVLRLFKENFKEKLKHITKTEIGYKPEDISFGQISFNKELYRR